MWVFLNDSFFSIVDKKAKESHSRNATPSPDDLLVVRARVKGDIERVFKDEMNGALRVTSSQTNDYRFRAMIPRRIVQDVMAAEVGRIGYGNFKDSVDEDDRHDAYSGVWSVMYRFQSKRLPSRSKPLF